jgi:archaellin
MGDDNNEVRIIMKTLTNRVTTVRVFWNNYSDSTDIHIDNNIGVFSQIIPYSGSDYIFQIVSIDKLGNKSRPSEAAATMLRDREISLSAVASNTGALYIGWTAVATGFIDQYCALSYVNNVGEQVSQNVYSSESLTSINDYASDLSYHNVFLLGDETVYSDEVAVTVGAGAGAGGVDTKLNKVGWSIEVSDEHSEGGGKDKIIDGIYGNNGHWHTNYSPVVPCPHWAVIDMKSPTLVFAVEVERRAREAKTIECYVGDSPDANGSWTKIAEGAFASENEPHVLKITAANPGLGRYVKLVFVDTFRPDSNYAFVVISEIDVYGIQ